MSNFITHESSDDIMFFSDHIETHNLLTKYYPLDLEQLRFKVDQELFALGELV